MTIDKMKERLGEITSRAIFSNIAKKSTFPLSHPEEKVIFTQL